MIVFVFEIGYFPFISNENDVMYLICFLLNGLVDHEYRKTFWLLHLNRSIVAIATILSNLNCFITVMKFFE